MSIAPSTRRDPALVATALREWLRERLADPEARLLSVVRPSGAGLSNETFLLELVGAHGPQALVVQVGPAGHGLFRDYDLLTMARVQQQLAAVSDVPVAPVRWVESSGRLLGTPFYVMSRVAGQVPSDNPAYHASGWFAQAPPAVQAAAWSSGIAAMVRLHALHPVSAGFQFLEAAPWGMQTDANAALTRIAQWRALLEWGARRRIGVIENAFERLAATAPPTTRIAVCWGDAKISNCIIDGARVVALLDWELCGLSDPHEDLAHWLLLDWAHWRVQGLQRLPALPTPSATVAAYEAQSGCAMPYARWWFQLAFVRLAVIYHRFLERRVELGRLDGQTDLAALNPMCGHLDEVLTLETLP